MKNVKRISVPLTAPALKQLKTGDEVLISGTVLVARDAAHQRFTDLLKKKKKLPVDLKNRVIFYAGPAPARPGSPIGSIGPTSSYRMDPHTGPLLEQGLKGIIGKGERSDEVTRALQKHGAVYFVAIGGIAALLSKKVIASRILAYPELGTEAVRELTVKDLPVIVAQDMQGKNIYTK